VALVREVELDTLLALRDRALTPGHPGRPIIWPYDNESATHFGVFIAGQLVGCVSITPQEMPGRAARKPYHLHSMAVEPEHQGIGLGREMLASVLETVRNLSGDLIWATARPSAVTFYRRCGFQAGEEMLVPPTNAPMRYVWRLTGK